MAHPAVSKMIKRNPCRKNEDLKQKIITGSFWTVFTNVFTRLISLIMMIFLARLLTPEDFGVVAISTVFVGVVTLFQNLGMGSAIIQRQEIDDDYLSTSFTVSVITGIVLAGLLAAVSTFIADFYNEKIVRDIILISSLGLIIGPLSSTHIAILTKNLDFKTVSIIEIVQVTLTVIISIALALYGYGPWSIALGKLIPEPLMIPFVWKLVRWRPRVVIVKKCFNDLFGYSSHLLGSNFVGYLARNIDNLIIGKFLGTEALGYYSVAYNIMIKPLPLISWSIGRVFFPVFSVTQKDKERTRQMYLKVIRSISLLTFPMMTGLIMVAEEFILTIYGAQWKPVILPLQLLCIVGALQSIGTTGELIFNSHGRPDISLKMWITTTIAYVFAFLAGINWGLIGLIASYLIISIPIFFAGQYFANRLMELKMAVFLKEVVPAVLCSTMMLFVLFIIKYFNMEAFHLNIGMSLIMLIAVGAGSYVLFALKVLKVPEFSEAIQIVKRKL